MNGTISLDPSDRIYLDTNVFIEAFEKRGELSNLVVSLLVANSQQRPQRLVTSELALAEILVRPLELKDERLVRDYEGWITTNSYLEVYPIGRAVLWHAAELRANDKTLKLPDAIHLTTAIETKCRYFLTNDKRIVGNFELIFCRSQKTT
jgi:predicted nucleic acid-binding protein